MMFSRFGVLGTAFSLLLLLSAGSANAVVISVSDWFVAGLDDGSADFRVTEVFTSAAELGGADNRYQYSFENLTSNLSANLFRMSNPTSPSSPTGAPRTSMTGPSSWTERSGAINFLWETVVSADYVGPGESLSGLTLLTTAILPALTSSTLAENGWIQTYDLTGQQINVFGQFPRDGSSTVPAAPVPEPTPFALFGLGFLMLTFRKWRLTTSLKKI